MFIYGKFPIVSTESLTKAFSKYSDDPLTQVVAIAYDSMSNMVIAYGVNKLIKPLQNTHAAQRMISEEKHPAKKFLMNHAEIDLLNKLKTTLEKDRKNIKIYVNLQPCMECTKAMAEFGIKHIEWFSDNRHQEEQALMSDFIGYCFERYAKNSAGLMLQIPQWIMSENELKEAGRDTRSSEDAE